MTDFTCSTPLLLGGVNEFQLRYAGMPENASPACWAAQRPPFCIPYLKTPCKQAQRCCARPPILPAFTTWRHWAWRINLKLSTPPWLKKPKSGRPLRGPRRRQPLPSGSQLPPQGNADFDDDIYQFYRRQVRVLKRAGAEFIVLDRQCALADMRAAVLACRTTGLPVLALVEADSKGETATGSSLLSCLITLQSMGAAGVGLAAAQAEEGMHTLLKAAPHAAVPLAAPVTEALGGEGGAPALSRQLALLVQQGVRIFDARRCNNPELIRELAQCFPLLPPLSPLEEPDPDCYAVAVEGEVFFLGDNFVYSDPLPCTSHLADDLIDLEDESINTALVEVEDLSEALILAEAAPLSRLPIAVRCTSLPVLDAAVRYFQGRLIIDTDCPLEEEELTPFVGKYGAILY
ncbi:MAG: homocysteine S-methyltransferase family protein [Hydrogeniiclostridium mannosilyticum]